MPLVSRRVTLKNIYEEDIGQVTHHSCDTDQNQNAAEIGVLVFLWFTVNVVHNFKDQFLLQLNRKIRTVIVPVSTDQVLNYYCHVMDKTDPTSSSHQSETFHSHT